MLTKTKNIRKNKFLKFFLIKKTSEHMAQGKQQPKFERKPWIRFRAYCDTDGQRPNCDFMSSADIVKQS